MVEAVRANALAPGPLRPSEPPSGADRDPQHGDRFPRKNLWAHRGQMGQHRDNFGVRASHHPSDAPPETCSSLRESKQLRRKYKHPNTCSLLYQEQEREHGR